MEIQKMKHLVFCHKVIFFHQNSFDLCWS